MRVLFFANYWLDVILCAWIEYAELSIGVLIKRNGQKVQMLW